MKRTTIYTAWIRRAAWTTGVLLLGLLLSSCGSAVGGINSEVGEINSGGEGDKSDSFVSVWKTDLAGASDPQQLQLPLVKEGVYDFTVDWGDGTTSKISSWDDVQAKHTYTTPGEYAVTITGTFEGWRFLSDPTAAPGSEDYGDAPKLMDIKQWGTMGLGEVDSHFKGATNLLGFTARDVPDLKKTESLKSSFEGAEKFNGDLSNWDISNVKDMSHMLKGATAFNQDLDMWDVSGVIDYHDVFVESGMTPSQQPQKFRAFISQWKTNNAGVSKNTAIQLPLVLEGNYDFRVDWGDGKKDIISAWDAGEATHDYGTAGIYTVRITGVFEGWRFMVDPDDSTLGYRDSNKLLDILQWGGMALGAVDSHFAYTILAEFSASDTPDLSKTTSLRQTFAFSAFNGDLSNWDVSQVTNMASMVEWTPFNQNISGWDVSKVTNMQRMFSLAYSFNQDIGDWAVSSVEDMSWMFQGGDFNQDISNWDVSSVTDMERMFQSARAFDQDISGWDVSKVQSYYNVFAGSGIDGDTSKQPSFP